MAVWSGHLGANLETMVDISPASLGNFPLSSLPTDFADYPQFYDYVNGGDPSTGYELNPVTGEPYTPQVVRLGDYARILAEFWEVNEILRKMVLYGALCSLPVLLRTTLSVLVCLVSIIALNYFHPLKACT